MLLEVCIRLCIVSLCSPRITLLHYFTSGQCVRASCNNKGCPLPTNTNPCSISLSETSPSNDSPSRSPRLRSPLHKSLSYPDLCPMGVKLGVESVSNLKLRESAYRRLLTMLSCSPRIYGWKSLRMLPYCALRYLYPIGVQLAIQSVTRLHQCKHRSACCRQLMILDHPLNAFICISPLGSQPCDYPSVISAWSSILYVTYCVALGWFRKPRWVKSSMSIH